MYENVPQKIRSWHVDIEWMDWTGIFWRRLVSWSGAKIRSPTDVDAMNQGWSDAILIGSSSNSIEIVDSLSSFLYSKHPEYDVLKLKVNSLMRKLGNS